MNTAARRSAAVRTEPVRIASVPSTSTVTWEASSTASRSSAERIRASVPEAGAAPELLLRATGHDGTGVFSDVDYVQRLATRGGAAPGGPCADGQQRAVGYDAEYRFFAPGA